MFTVEYPSKFLSHNPNPQTNVVNTYIFQRVEVCPRCHAKICPEFLNSCYQLLSAQSLGLSIIADFLVFETHLLCPACYRTFIATNVIENIHGSKSYARLLCTEPYKYQKSTLADRFPQLTQLSPRFVSIYDQATAAESLGLTEIAGLGYRKALEILVKDYSISAHPEQTDLIQEIPLSQCIGRYINEPKIKTLAQRASWLGNDAAHYSAKHLDKGLEDLKALVECTAYFVEMELVYRSAQEIKSK